MEEKRREEEEARRREEEEAARRAREAEEENRRAKEAEEARRLKEVEEKARQLAEVEEAARRAREEKLDAEQKAAEQQDSTALQQPTVKPSGQEAERDGTLVPEHKDKCPVEIEDKGRTHFQVSKEQKDLEKIPWVEAGPHPELPKNQRANESESYPRSEGTEAKSSEPQPGPSHTRAPPLSKLPASRSQEKRELRRQRGMEHNQRESQRAAGKDDPSFKSKTLESPSKAEGKLKERADSKELDQYTFVAWKVDKVKKDELVRPSTLPLDIPASGTGRNGYGDPGIAEGKPSSVKEEANKRKEPSRSNTQPENLIIGPRSLEDKNIKLLQYDFIVLFCRSDNRRRWL